MKLLSLALLCVYSTAAAAEKPNIVFILADDIGYGDLGCYGATLVKTPNLDRLAREGRRFTDAHSPASTCTPTRRALLTGTYSWRQQPGSSIAPGDAALSIPPGTATLPSLLKQAGYTTGAVGKWHLGLGPEGGPDWNADIKPGPLEIGFDYAFFMPATGDRVPCVYVEDHRIVGLDPADPIRVSYAAKVGDEPTGRDHPELLKLKHTHGHDNTIVNGVGRIGWMTGGKAARWVDEDMADTYTQKAIAFIERSSRAERDSLPTAARRAGAEAPGNEQPFFLYLATHNIHVPRVPNQRFKGASGCGIRGDSIQELDDVVGKVLAALDRLKLTEKTLVIFSSDNGGVMDDGYEDFGSLEHKCNGALRGYKGSLFEGGHRVPFIARWPGKIKAGTECTELITLLDMAASFASLTGVPLPADAVPDSIDVLPALLDQPHEQPLRKDFIAHVGGIKGPFGIRQGPWKLLTGAGGYGGGPKPDKPAEPQLFNLADDPDETRNAAADHPEIVQLLKGLVAKQREQGRTR